MGGVINMNLFDAWKFESGTVIVNSKGNELTIPEKDSRADEGFASWRWIYRSVSTQYALDDTWEKKKDKVEVIKHIDTTITTAYPGKTIKVTYEWEE